MNPQPLAAWINERHAIYIRKTLLEGKAIPPEYDGLRGIGGSLVDPKWSLDHLTDDPVMAKYRFCNVFRELDRVTIWIRENIREPYADSEHLWFMLAIARTINWPDTLQFLIENAWPGRPDFTPALLGQALDDWKAAGEKVYTGAYMIRAESDPKAEWYSWTKQRYIAEIVLGRLWEDRGDWEQALSGNTGPGCQLREMSLQGAWEAFQPYTGWGPFMAYEVVTDLRHTRYLRNAPDINTWANAGPGAIRGLNRLLGRPLAEQMPANVRLGQMQELLALLNAGEWLAPWVPGPLELRDVEHSLCEFDKWQRALKGEGKPRAGYVRGRGW